MRFSVGVARLDGSFLTAWIALTVSLALVGAGAAAAYQALGDACLEQGDRPEGYSLRSLSEQKTTQSISNLK